MMRRLFLAASLIAGLFGCATPNLENVFGSGINFKSQEEWCSNATMRLRDLGFPVVRDCVRGAPFLDSAYTVHTEVLVQPLTYDKPVNLTFMAFRQNSLVVRAEIRETDLLAIPAHFRDRVAEEVIGIGVEFLQAVRNMDTTYPDSVMALAKRSSGIQTPTTPASAEGFATSPQGGSVSTGTAALTTITDTVAALNWSNVGPFARKADVQQPLPPNNGGCRVETIRPSPLTLPRSSIAQVFFKGFRTEDISERERENLETLFEAYLDLPPGVALATMRDVQTSLDLERQKDILGCDDASCAAQIAGALGAAFVITGNVGKLGKSFMLSSRVIDTVSARPVGKVTVKYEQRDCLAAAAQAAAVAVFATPP